MAAPTTAAAPTTEQSAGTASAAVSKSAPDAQTKNTIVRYRKVKVQVLDCRSGAPLVGVPVYGAWLADADGSNAAAIAKYKWLERDWDIAGNLPISTAAGKWYIGKPESSLGRAVQTALNALGFDCGVPNAKYSDQALTACLKFMVSRRQVALSPDSVAALNLTSVAALPAEKLGKNKAGKRVLKGITTTDGKEVLFEPPSEDQARKLIFREYNTRCFRAAQFHLATMGFVPTGQDPLSDGQVDDADPLLDNRDEGRWSQGWIDAYKRWQGVVLGRKKPSDGWIKSKEDGAALMNGVRRFVTDERGILHIPVPVARIKAGFRVELTFKDFCVVAESTRKEFEAEGAEQVFRSPRASSVAAANADSPKLAVPSASAGPTGFRVQWTGPTVFTDSTTNPQKAEAAPGTVQSVPWGWTLERDSGSAKPRRTAREFRTSWSFQVPAFDYGAQEKIDWWALQQSGEAPFSMFYDGSDTTPEFVLFALVWCQPVYDTFKDAAPRADGPVVTDDAYVWPNGEHALNMHVVTQFYDMGGWDIYGGKGYGLWERERWTRWRGVDHAISVKGGLLRLRVLGYHVGRDPDSGDVPELTGDELKELYDEELQAKLDSDGSEQGVRCMQFVSDFQADDGIPTTGELDALTLQRLDNRVRAAAKADPSNAAVSPPRRPEWDDPFDGHSGVDLHAGVGAPLFAGHGGTFSWLASSGMIGNLAQVKWTGKGRTNLGYGHCKSKVGGPRYVRAGEIIALAGRTGNLAAVSDQAGHVHMNCGDPDRDGVRLTPPDPANQACFPKNGVTPLLLPCRCELTQPAGPGEIELKDCKFDNAKAAGKAWLRTASCCWAVAELACPHMPRGFNAEKLKEAGAIKERRCVQAQLRKLGLYTPDPQSTPQDPKVKSGAQTTALDGDFGAYTETLKVGVEGAKLRAEASKESTALASLPKGTALTPLGTSGEWHRVKAGGQEGFMHNSVVSVSGLSDTRRAILAFKEQQGLLPANATAEQKYEMDKAALDRLNSLAPLAPKA